MSKHEELAADLDECADSCVLAEKHNWAQHMRRAAALLREARPQPVPVAAPTPDDFRRWWRETGSDDSGPTPEMLLTANAWASSWAARCAQAIPQPVPVAERPWERPEWCDAEGRCWFGAPVAGAADAGWILRKPSERLSHQTVSLPHWAIPQPPQGGEVDQ